jgi:hypothetical protein
VEQQVEEHFLFFLATFLLSNIFIEQHFDSLVVFLLTLFVVSLSKQRNSFLWFCWSFVVLVRVFVTLVCLWLLCAIERRRNQYPFGHRDHGVGHHRGQCL